MAQDRADPETVAAFLADDQGAAKAIETHIRAVFRHWQGRFGYETDDILSDVWLELLESLRRGDFKYQSGLKPYIRQIVNHTCIDYLRFRQRVKIVDVDTIDFKDKHSNAEEDLARRQEASIAFRVLRRMPEECRRMWRMKLQQGMSCREIGEILKKTEGNIRRRLWACREEARKIREKITRKDKLFRSPNAM
jgi:RNA polymerase sigma factor (sigma-70 family)